MNEQEEQWLSQVENKLQLEQDKNVQLQTDINRVSSNSYSGDANIVEFQLNLDKELDRMYHLLSGHQLVIDKKGNEVWEEPDDDRLKIFSDYGVKQIMNIISFYINKNTLLSNYDEKTIIWKVRDFGIELSDLIYTRYEDFFYYPKPEELFEKYKDQANLKNITIEELYYKCAEWSNEELQNKIAHYPMICLSLIDAIHSTYLRALGGKERESLRKGINVMERVDNSMRGMGMQPQNQKFKLWKPKTWA